MSYERTSRGEDNTIWAWTDRGYDLLQKSGIDFEVAGEPRSPARLGADLLVRDPRRSEVDRDDLVDPHVGDEAAEDRGAEVPGRAGDGESHRP